MMFSSVKTFRKGTVDSVQINQFTPNVKLKIQIHKV